MQPHFTSNSLVPVKAKRPEPLKPGMIVAIYGTGLGPQKGCTENSETPELCGVTVTVAGRKAGLFYAQDLQVNFRVPHGAPGEGLVPVVVTYNGRSSPAVPVRFEPYVARISVDGAAYVHMPVWVRVDLPEGLGRSLRYPMTLRPADFDGHWFEVRRNGRALAPIPPPPGVTVVGGPCGYGGIGCGSMVGLPHEPKERGRLPLHLLYRFDEHGAYEVRYVGYGLGRNVLARSAWTPLQVRPFSPQQRLAWLKEMRTKAPADPVELLSDFLPSLLAVPDEAASSILRPYLRHSNELVRQYVGAAGTLR
jgi:hypothetical protein